MSFLERSFLRRLFLRDRPTIKLKPESFTDECPHRFSSRNGRKRLSELAELFNGNSPFLSGIVHKTNFVHGYDCQTTVLFLGNGEVWGASSTDFGEGSFEQLKDEWVQAMAQAIEILNSEECKGRVRFKDDPNYGRYTTVYAVDLKNRLRLQLQDVHGKSELRSPIDHWLAALQPE